MSRLGVATIVAPASTENGGQEVGTKKTVGVPGGNGRFEDVRLRSR